jgi:4-hydroxybenzoate polyprenyltransferase
VTETATADPRKSKLLAYVQLLRLPNVFTAVADVSMGYLFTHDASDWRPALAGALPLLLASALLYMAGMVLNDVFDVELDRAERPERPLPSGRILISQARWIGFELLLFGGIAGAAVSFWSHDPRPAAVVIGLAALILVYDGLLKQTLLGPLAMGGCRFLNVLLGMSAASQPWQTANYIVAVGIGVYIVGVTWFARSEAEPQSRRGQLLLAMLPMFAGMGLLAYFPEELPQTADFEPHQLLIDPQKWHLCWVLLALLTGWRCLRCVVQPYGEFVREAIRQCLVSLIIFDAAIVVAVRGVPWGIAVVLLIVPMTILGRWSYST